MQIDNLETILARRKEIEGVYNFFTLLLTRNPASLKMWVYG